MKINAVTFGMRNNYNRGVVNSNRTETERRSQYFQNPVQEFTKVPLAIIIAMSPLSVQAQQSAIQDSTVQKEAVVQDNPVKCIAKKEITTTDGNEFCRFLFYNTDENKKDVELLGFNFNCYTNEGNIGVMNGVFQAICPEKTADGRYLAAYEEIINSENTGIVKPCLVSGEFGDFLIKFANSKYNNNAVDITGKKDFEEAFGHDEIDKVRNLSDYVTTIIYPAE